MSVHLHPTPCVPSPTPSVSSSRVQTVFSSFLSRKRKMTPHCHSCPQPLQYHHTHFQTIRPHQTPCATRRPRQNLTFLWSKPKPGHRSCDVPGFRSGHNWDQPRQGVLGGSNKWDHPRQGFLGGSTKCDQPRQGFFGGVRKWPVRSRWPHLFNFHSTYNKIRDYRTYLSTVTALSVYL